MSKREYDPVKKDRYNIRENLFGDSTYYNMVRVDQGEWDEACGGHNRLLSFLLEDVQKGMRDIETGKYGKGLSEDERASVLNWALSAVILM